VREGSADGVSIRSCPVADEPNEAEFSAGALSLPIPAFDLTLSTIDDALSLYSFTVA